MFRAFDNPDAKEVDPIPDGYEFDYMVWQLCKGDATKAEHYWNMPYFKALEWFSLAKYDIYVQNEQMKVK